MDREGRKMEIWRIYNEGYGSEIDIFHSVKEVANFMLHKQDVTPRIVKSVLSWVPKLGETRRFCDFHGREFLFGVKRV